MATSDRAEFGLMREMRASHLPEKSPILQPT
jgi:hypothetical protein